MKRARVNMKQWIKRLQTSLLLGAFLGLAACGSSSSLKPAALTTLNSSSTMSQAWQSTAGSSFNYPAQLVINGQYLASAGSQGHVTILNLASGLDAWRYKLDASVVSGVGFDGQLVALTTQGNELVVLKPNIQANSAPAVTTNPVLWRQRLASRVYTAPLVAGGRVFVLAADRSISAFDADTGVRLWGITRPQEPLVLSQMGTLGIYKNTLLVGGSGRLLGINPDTGQIAWETAVAVTRATNDIERLMDLVGAPNRVGDSVCVRAYQVSVACVDPKQGMASWSKNTQGSVGVSGDAGVVASTESDGRIKLWNRQSGDLIWSIDSLAHRGLSAPLVIGESIVVGDFEGIVHVLNKRDGQFAARFKTDGSAIAAAPVVSGNVVVVATAKGGIFAFKP